MIYLPMMYPAKRAEGPKIAKPKMIRQFVSSSPLHPRKMKMGSGGRKMHTGSIQHHKQHSRIRTSPVSGILLVSTKCYGARNEKKKVGIEKTWLEF